MSVKDPVIRRDENGRRYKRYARDCEGLGLGPECRLYAPAGPDGEQEDDGFPFNGKYYVSGLGPWERWYLLGVVGYTPEGGCWMAYERCNPIEGETGMSADEPWPPLKPYSEDELADTIPGVI